MTYRDSYATSVPMSSALFAWDAADGPAMRWATGGLMARTGHEGTWSRGAATLASVLAATGSYTAQGSMPGWEARTIGGVAQTVLRCGTSDRVTWVPGHGPQPFTWRMSFIELGARTAANSTLWAYANDAVSGVRFFVDTSGSFYRVTYHNGSTFVTATLTSGAPTSGQDVLLWGTWAANGAVTINQRINGGSQTSASSGALALPSAWAAGTLIRLNRRGASVNAAQGAYRSLVIAPGVLSESEILEVY